MFDRPTKYQPTNRPTNQQTDMRVHKEVTLPFQQGTAMIEQLDRLTGKSTIKSLHHRNIFLLFPWLDPRRA